MAIDSIDRLAQDLGEPDYDQRVRNGGDVVRAAAWECGCTVRSQRSESAGREDVSFRPCNAHMGLK